MLKVLSGPGLRALILLLTLGLFLAAPALSGAALPAGEADITSASETLALAKTLLEQGRLEDSENLYASLSLNSSEEIRVESTFQLAQIRLLQGQPRPAITLLLKILNRYPGLPRVRLELARAYFLDKNYEDAAFQFELVKGGDLPPEVLAKVDVFLDAIRRQKNWTLDFSFSPVSDSNMSQASGEHEECIDLEGLLLCSPLTEKASGVGLSANATLNYFWRFHQDWGLKATVGFYGQFHEQDEYDDYSFYAALGPRYLWESGEASLQPTFRKRWAGGRQYSEDYGLRLDAQRIFGKLILSGGASYAEVRYADSYVNSVLKGPTWSLRLQPRYILTNQTFVQAGVEFLRQETEIRAYANDNWRYSLGAFHAFPYGFSLYGEGSVTRTRYQDSQWYVTRDNQIDVTTREDTTWGLATVLSSNILESYGLTPSLQYSYTKRDSNIWSRSYDRHRVNLLVNYRL